MTDDVWWGSDEPLGLLPTYEDDDYGEGASLVRGCAAVLGMLVVTVVGLVLLVAAAVRWGRS